MSILSGRGPPGRLILIPIEHPMDNRLRKLYIEPSSLCNFHCTMCFRNAWHHETTGLMTEQTFQNLLEGLQDHLPEKVVFGGMGEPLTHPSLCTWVHAFHEVGCQTEIITNGSLLTESRTEALCAAGLTCLWISIDSVQPEHYETIQNGAKYENLMKTLSSFQKVREDFPDTHLGITFVMLPENLCELTHMNAFIDSVGADLINISHAIPNSAIDREKTTFDMRLPVGKMTGICDDFSSIPAGHCPFIEDRAAFVRWDGDIAPCMQLLHETDTWLFSEQRRIYRKSFGNVNEVSVWDAWNSKEYRQFYSMVLSFDFPDCIHCDGCELRQENLTDCMVHDFPTCGACLWSTGKVFCP